MDARSVILQGLGERFGFIDATRNPDLDDIDGYYVRHGHSFVVVKTGAELIGTGALIREPDNVMRIARVSVRVDFRRRGIAKAIVNHLVDIAAPFAPKALVLETNRTWLNAIELYERLGFIQVGQEREMIHFSRTGIAPGAGPRSGDRG